MGLQTDKFPFLRSPRPPPLCNRPSGVESLSSPGSRKIRHRVGIDPEIGKGGGGGGAGNHQLRGSRPYIFIAIKPLKTLYFAQARRTKRFALFYYLYSPRVSLVSAVVMMFYIFASFNKWHEWHWFCRSLGTKWPGKQNVSRVETNVSPSNG